MCTRTQGTLRWKGGGKGGDIIYDCGTQSCNDCSRRVTLSRKGQCYHSNYVLSFTVRNTSPPWQVETCCPTVARGRVDDFLHRWVVNLTEKNTPCARTGNCCNME